MPRPREVPEAPPGQYYCRGHGQYLPLDQFCPSASSPRRRHTLCKACSRKADAKHYEKPSTKELRLLADTRRGLGHPTLSMEMYKLALAEHGWRCVCTGARWDLKNGSYLVLVRVAGTRLLAPVTRRWASLYKWELPRKLYVVLRKKHCAPLQQVFMDIPAPHGDAAAPAAAGSAAALAAGAAGDARNRPDSAPSVAAPGGGAAGGTSERAERVMSPHAEALADKWTGILMRRLAAARRLHAAPGAAPGAAQQHTGIVRKAST